MKTMQAKGSVIVANGTGGVTVISPTSAGQIFVLDTTDPKGAKFTDIKELLPTQKVKMIASSSNYTSLQSYQQIMETSVPGESSNRILSIKVISYCQTGIKSYSVIVTNADGKTIAEKTFENTTSAENNMGELANLPKEQGIIRFAIKKNSIPTTKYAYLLSVDIEMSP